MEASEGEAVRPVQAVRLWQILQLRGHALNRFERVLLAAILYLLIGVCLWRIFPMPFVPFRGAVSFGVDRVLGWGGFALLVVLTFYVVDASLLCRWFIEGLAERPTKWPEPLLKKHSDARHMDKAHLDEWLDMQMIAQRTRVVSKLIYYPFLVLVLMIVARNSYFDHWDWPLSVILIYAIAVLFALSCVVMRLRSAQRVRRLELGRLRLKLLAARGNPDLKPQVAQLEQTIQDIEAIREGAFAPLVEQPFVRALVMLTGGSSLVPLLELLGRVS